MRLVCRLAAPASALFLFAISDAVPAQDEASFDVILIKELNGGAQTEDANFVSIMEGAVEQWINSAARVLVLYEQELPSDREERANYFRRHGLLHAVRAMFLKSGSSAAVRFVITRTDAAAEEGLPAVSKFPHTTVLPPNALNALPLLERDLELLIVPTLKFYLQSAKGTQVLADCIRPELNESRPRSASKQITRRYSQHMAAQSGGLDLQVQGLTEAQIDDICLKLGAQVTPALRYDRLSDNPSIRKLYHHVVFGDLAVDGERIYLTWEDRDGAATPRTIRVPQGDFDGKAIELATQILELISIP